MSEYRNRTTGLVQSQGAWRAANPNMSLPRVWKQATLDALDLDPVLKSPAATVGQYQTSVRDGVVQDANGNWVEKYIAKDMFTSYTDEEGVFHSKLDQEQAYQAGLDAKVAETNRKKRNELLTDTDWTQMNDSPLTNELKTAWATYRQELRQITDLDAWPNLADEDWPVEP